MRGCTEWISPPYLQSAMSSSSKENNAEARSTSGSLVAIMYVTSAILLFWQQRKVIRENHSI